MSLCSISFLEAGIWPDTSALYIISQLGNWLVHFTAPFLLSENILHSSISASLLSCELRLGRVQSTLSVTPLSLGQFPDIPEHTTESTKVIHLKVLLWEAEEYSCGTLNCREVPKVYSLYYTLCKCIGDVVHLHQGVPLQWTPLQCP